MSDAAIAWPTLRGVLVDLDGVVYTGDSPVPDAASFLAEARRRGFPYLMITNNSTTPPERVAERLSRMGIDVRPEEVLTSAQAAASHVRNELGEGARVLVVGEAGLRAALTAEGLTPVEGGQVDCVVAGLDRTFDYARLTAATRAILQGASFVATNADALLPVEGGGLLPGAGSIVAAIATATGFAPTVIGKPEAALFEQGLRRLGDFASSEVAMIGDRLDTDLDGGRRVGLRTILVLTGVATAADARAAAIPPDVVVPTLADVAGLLGWEPGRDG